MKWIFLVAALAACALSGLLGLTAGINLNPESTVKFVPSWGSLGDWVSGIGALSAVAVTLWLADQQRREDVESLKIEVKAAFTTYHEQWFIAVNVISDGKRPAEIIGLSVFSPHAKHYIAIPSFGIGSSLLPASLTYGQRITLHLDLGFEEDLRRFVDVKCNGISKGLKFVVSTTLGTFDAPIHENMLSLNQ